MAVHPLAGKPAPKSLLVNVPRLVSTYYTLEPAQPVAFGTSGHRGTSLAGAFNELHIAAAAQAICDYRKSQKIDGPLFLGFDTHALSEPAFRTTVEVLAANGVEVILHAGDEYTPTPVISFLILEHNRGRTAHLADGVVVTPSHNPPEDGGFKYNPPSGGPSDVDASTWIQDRANQLMSSKFEDIRMMPYEAARRASTTHEQDFISRFMNALEQVVNLSVIRDAKIKIGVDPLGGSSVHFWAPIADRYGLDLEIVNPHVDHTFGFMTVDSDGKIRMDCSSPDAMANLIGLSSKFDVAWGNDPDADRHGIVCKSGLMNPNHYLSVAIWYLIQNRPVWNANSRIGKTVVTSSLIDKVAAGLNRRVYEVPVGFKWFVDGLLSGDLAFGGEESAGATMLRLDGTPWTTDKDGFCLTLLAAEIMAKTGLSPADIYRDKIVPAHGEPYYRRVDGPITDDQKSVLKSLTPSAIRQTTLAGKKIAAVLTEAPGNNAPLGGVKATLEDGSWFAIRPSGTEPKMKLYIESFGGEDLWRRIAEEAMPLIFG